MIVVDCHRVIVASDTRYRAALQLGLNLVPDHIAKDLTPAQARAYRIWGVDTFGATRALYPFKPFLWPTYVTCLCMGIRRDTAFDSTKASP